ncbi:MAG: AAA family ATPase, partial [Rhodobacteraceae bacterium]|nr:AAA family ATPase [Paracoccaceae bacterium]
MKLKRSVDLPGLLAQKSHFLFGPRGTGKTFLAREQLGGKAAFCDLLHSDTYLTLSTSPSDLEDMVHEQITRPNEPVFVVIDEIQKLPSLLDETHRLIESKGWKFLLTGSSARKLYRRGVNLLAGRAWNQNLHPLTWKEIPDFHLSRHLRYGGLPAVYLSSEPRKKLQLQAYVTNYIEQEIQMEGLVRKIPQFSRFLKAAALTNGKVLNFDKLGRDYAMPPSTIREYYSILQETFIGMVLEPLSKSTKRKAVSTSKFHFFDTGVLAALNGMKTLERNSDIFGNFLETWLVNEVRAYISYRRLHLPLHYWRTTAGYEVDLVADDEAAIEIKSTRRVAREDLKGLTALKEEGIVEKFFL